MSGNGCEESCDSKFTLFDFVGLTLNEILFCSFSRSAVLPEQSQGI